MHCTPKKTAMRQSTTPDGSGNGTTVNLTPSGADAPKTNESACEATIDVLKTGIFQAGSVLVANT